MGFFLNNRKVFIFQTASDLMTNSGRIGVERVNELEAHSEELGHSIEGFIDYIEHNLSNGALKSINPLLINLKKSYQDTNEKLGKIFEEDEIAKRYRD